MKVLILGTNGMFAKELIKTLQGSIYKIYGTTRRNINHKLNNDFNLVGGVDFRNIDSVFNAINQIKPDFVLNLVGITKYKEEIADYSDFIEINSLAPHKIASFCETNKIRLIQLSTDCVFSGNDGNYLDSDQPDPIDVYGKTKALGELHKYKYSLTIRTSFIGHNSNSKDGLLEWFLDQENSCKGYKSAIYSGLTTIELAKVFKKVIFKGFMDNRLSGVCNVSSDKISKYDLLVLIARVYGKSIEIQESNDWIIDRSLDSSKFCSITGYNPPNWEKMIIDMHKSKYGNF